MNKVLMMLACTLALISCSKTETPEPEPVNNKVLGDWTIVNISAAVYQSETETNMAGTDSTREVRLFNFVSYEQLGEMTMDDSTMNIIKLSYKYKNKYHVTNYHNGIFKDSATLPSSTEAYEASYKFPYKMINADSLYLNEGTVTYYEGGPLVSPAKGAKIVRVADTLYVTTTEITQSKLYVRDDMNVLSYSSRLQTIKYMKKK